MKYGAVFIAWLPLAATITGLCGLAFAAVQQNYRQSLNDPQIQMVEDAARDLQAGASPASVLPKGEKKDIATSLASFIVVYDASGKPIASSATLDNALPVLPSGAFQAAAGGVGKDTDVPGQNRITWQPRDNVRVAAVVQYFSAGDKVGYVMAGRNMREIEIRESKLFDMVKYIWGALLIITFGVELIVFHLRKRS